MVTKEDLLPIRMCLEYGDSQMQGSLKAYKGALEAIQELEKNESFASKQLAEAAEKIAALEAELAEARKDGEWQSAETAPRGEVTENAGCWGASEWFEGYLKTGHARTMKRLPWNYGHTWCDMDQTYYTEDWLIAWRPLPSPPEVTR